MVLYVRDDISECMNILSNFRMYIAFGLGSVDLSRFNMQRKMNFIVTSLVFQLMGRQLQFVLGK